jgi:hypothetical protein
VTFCCLATPTRGFTADVSVFWGTPPEKPFGFRYSAIGDL